MRRRRLVPIGVLAGQQVLDEADSVGRMKTAEVDHRSAEAMVEKAVGEAQRVVDCTGAQAPLLDEVDLVIGQEFSPGDLPLCQWRGLCHTDVD
jgi:hypothetical protein